MLDRRQFVGFAAASIVAPSLLSSRAIGQQQGQTRIIEKMPNQKKTTPLVDSHAHVIAKDIPILSKTPRHSERERGPLRDASAEELIKLLDASGISHCLLAAPSIYGTNNKLTLDTIARYPDRFRGTAIVDPTISHQSLKDLRSRGIVGVRFNWLQWPELPDVRTPIYRGFFANLVAADLHLELFLEGERQADVVSSALGSGVKLVFDHFGCPPPDEGVKSASFQTLVRAAAAGQAWVKLSAPYRLRGAPPKPYVDTLLQAGAGDRLIWGSDRPWSGQADGTISYPECLDWLTQWIGDPKAIETVLSTTPLELLWA